MAHHSYATDVVTQAIVLELKAKVREQWKQLREQERETERLGPLASGRRYSDIQMILIAFATMVIGAGITLGILAAAGCWSS